MGVKISSAEVRRLRRNDQALRAWKGSLVQNVAEALPMLNGRKGLAEPDVHELMRLVRQFLQATMAMLDVIEFPEEDK